jgi:hypothetical protein
MDVPAEIWAEIVTFACVDDGRTVRALSLVSRFIHETSKQYKLQSIAVTGEQQLIAFPDLIEQTPTPWGRVECLFLSSLASNAPCPEFVCTHGVNSISALNLNRILCAISPCVRIVHTYSVFLRPFPLPISLPVLEELVVYYPFDAVCHSIQFTALKRLGLFCYPVEIEKVLRQTPSLVTLRISATSILPKYWFSIVKSGFPTQLQRVLILTPTDHIARHMEILGIYNYTLHFIRSLADANYRVALVQSDVLINFSVQGAEEAWEFSAAGIPWW